MSVLRCAAGEAV